MPDLAIIVPTRGRPANVRRVISAWDFTNAWDHADLVLVADADDPEIREYHEVVQDTMHPDTSEPLVRLMHVDEWQPMVHKLDRAARELAGRYFAVGFAGDDHLPQTIGWAKRYLDVLRELGTGMVYGDDGYQGAKLSTEWAVTSDVVRALGRMVPAPVEHMYCDNAMMDLFGAAGAMRHLPEVRIEHMHPVAGKAETDDQYRRVNHRDQFRRDRQVYERWHRLDLPSQIALVRQLRADRPDEAAPRPTPRTTTGRRPVARRGGTMSTRPPRFFKRVRAATPEPIMMALADFATQVPGDQEIVELGVFQGRTALQLAWGARQGQGAHVTAIDPWDLEGNVYDPPFTDDSSRKWAHHWVKSLGYSKDIRLVQAFSQDAAETWDELGEGKPVGLLFVDGDHTRDGARGDIVMWSRHLAPGALIAVDDYGHPDWPGVKEAVDELVDEGVLEPVEIFHDRLAVTRLTERKDSEPGRRPAAITSEGVSPSPYPEPVTDQRIVNSLMGGQPDPEVDRMVDEIAGLDDATSRRGRVSPEESLFVDGTSPNQEIEELNLAQLKALAKRREIVLGARKDKKAEIIAALKAGE